MTTAIATTGSGYTGADVDGLDKLSQEFTQAAQICDEVKMACEVIVAVASIFGPFGAAFVAYLKGTVIPWLQKISEALKMMAQVLSMHSTAQKDASSSATSLPSYTTPAGLPQTSTTNYPTLPAGVTPSTGTTTGAAGTPAGGSSTVSTPPAIGGTGTTAAGTTPTGTATDPTVASITALTGLVTAVDHLLHPGSATTTTATGTPVTPVTTTATGLGGTTGLDPTGSGTTPITGTTPVTTPVTGATPITGTVPGLGSTGGIDVSTLQPLHPGDSVGVISVPVDISPTGQITPLIHLPATDTSTPTGGLAAGAPISSGGSSIAAAATHALAHPLTGSGVSDGASTMTPALHGAAGTSGGSETSGGFGGGSGGASVPGVSSAHPTISSQPATLVHATHAATHHAAAPAGALGVAEGPGAAHDGLYSGLGQATGLGAGGAALARATLHEARQRAEGGLLGAVTLPADSGADGAVQARIFDGELR